MTDNAKEPKPSCATCVNWWPVNVNVTEGVVEGDGECRVSVSFASGWLITGADDWCDEYEGRGPRA